MEKSAKYDIVKKYYENENWNLYRVKMAVEKNWITSKEYKEITGESYV